MAGASTRIRREHALVPMPLPNRTPAQLRVSLAVTMLGLFSVAVLAGQLVLACAGVSTGVVFGLALTWRSMSRRYESAVALRDQGDNHLVRGRYDEARGSYEKALAIVQRELPPDAPEVLVIYYSLAAVHSMLQEHDKAHRYLDKLLQGLSDRVPSAWAGHVAWLMRRLAHHQSTQGRHREAIELCETALDLVGDAPGADDNTVRSLLDDLGWLHHHAGDYAAAEVSFRDALAVHEQYRDIAIEIAQRSVRNPPQADSPYRAPSPAAAPTTGALDRAVAYSLLGLGWTLYERGSYEEARTLFRRAHIVAASASDGADRNRGHRRSGAREPSALHVEILRGRAAVEMTLGAYDLAQEYYEAARGELRDEDGPLQAAALAIDLGWLARSRERYEEAERCYEEVLVHLERAGDGIKPLSCALQENLADLRRRQGMYKEAHRLIQKAATLAEQCHGPEHPRRASILALASRIHTARSEFGEGERAARKCLQVLRAALGRGHPRHADGYLALGEAQLGRGQLGAAEHAFGRALELRETMLGTEHPELVEVLQGHIAVLKATSRDEEAAAVTERAETLRSRLSA